MKYIVRYLEEKLKVRPLGKVITQPYKEYCDAYIGEEIIIDGQNTGIKVTYVDYISWLESKTSNVDNTSDDVRLVTCACSSIVSSIMFLNKSDAIQFDEALEEFCERGKNEWKDATSQYASREAVDYAINVTHEFHKELRGAYSQELFVMAGNSISSDLYTPILNYLNQVLKED